MGTPIFEAEWWAEDGRLYAHTLELDLVVSADDHGELAAKLGDAILDLLECLSEDDDATESEMEVIDLIASRIGQPLMQYYRRARIDHLKHDLLRWFRGGTVDWDLGQSSRHADSARALHA